MGNHVKSFPWHHLAHRRSGKGEAAVLKIHHTAQLPVRLEPSSKTSNPTLPGRSIVCARHPDSPSGTAIISSTSSATRMSLTTPVYTSWITPANGRRTNTTSRFDSLFRPDAIILISRFLGENPHNQQLKIIHPIRTSALNLSQGAPHVHTRHPGKTPLRHQNP